MKACFWCGATGVPINKDHVVPKSEGGVGGGFKHKNVVMSCHPCNQSRGRITSHKSTIKELSKFLNTGRMKNYRRLRRKLVKQNESFLLLQKKWIEIETAKLGHSPSGKICLELPSYDA
jgi:hypothetical protein